MEGQRSQGEPKRRQIFDDDDYIDPEEYEAMTYEDMAEMRDENLRDEFGRITAELGKDAQFIAVGKAGLGDGDRPTAFLASSIEDAYRKVMGRDCYSFRVWDENGALHFAGIRHDGVNSFEVRRLTGEGEAFAGQLTGDLTLADAKKLFEGMSEKPRIAERVHGCPAGEYETEPGHEGCDLDEELDTARSASAAMASPPQTVERAGQSL